MTGGACGTVKLRCRSRPWSKRMTAHRICRVCRVAVVAPYTLCVGFDDGTERSIDFQPVLAGELFAPLRDIRFFHRVKIDSDCRCSGTLRS